MDAPSGSDKRQSVLIFGRPKITLGDQQTGQRIRITLQPNKHTQNMSEIKYLTIPEAAKAVKPFPVTEKTIRRAIHRGNLKALVRKLGERPVYFVEKSDLEKVFSVLNA